MAVHSSASGQISAGTNVAAAGSSAAAGAETRVPGTPQGPRQWPHESGGVEDACQQPTLMASGSHVGLEGQVAARSQYRRAPGDGAMAQSYTESYALQQQQQQKPTHKVQVGTRV